MFFLLLDDIIKLDKDCFMNVFGSRRKVAFDHGDGIVLFDTDGNMYHDFFAGIAVNCLGHANKRLCRAIADQCSRVIHTSNAYYSEKQAYLAKKVTSMSCADKVYFSNSGAEANECALKLASLYWKKKGQNRTKFVSLKNSFHGRTFGTISVTGQEKYKKPYKDFLFNCVNIDANNLKQAELNIDTDTCAVILELVQGESGIHILSREYVDFVRELCDKTGAILIVDEIQTGMGRTGRLFAYEHFCLEPDIFTLAKALGGGVPIGATCAKDYVAEAFTLGEHGGTFGGNFLACAAALEVISCIEDYGLVSNSAEMGEYLLSGLKGISCCEISECRGLGLMIAVEFSQPIAKLIADKMFSKGYLVGSVGEHIIRISPPLIVNKKQIDSFISAFSQCLLEK